MQICVIGAGYVGVVTGACLASTGNHITFIDIDQDKIDRLNNATAPIYEEGLQELLQENRKRISATDDYDAVADSDVVFICVGTPSREDGSIDLSYVKKAAEQVGKRLGERWQLVVVKSTVIPGTTMNIVKPLLEQASGKTAGSDFDVAMNPEFLREGIAIQDFMQPDRVVIGTTSQQARELLEKLYEPFDAPLYVTSPSTAEMVKYASNALLATKISYANEIGSLCKQHGIDTYQVMEAVGMDHRIASSFLRAGAGFGGSCFPKDVRALIATGGDAGQPMHLLRAVMQVNDMQPHRMLELLKKHVGDLKDKHIAVLGLAFKPGTDDIRESRSIPVIRTLLDQKAHVSAYDPMATDNMREVFPDICYTDSPEEALDDADGCLVMTDWPMFAELDFTGMAQPIVIDGRRVIPEDKRTGIIYEGICW
jgi:UDPglucose 6-dehydrogenase